ncbi:MAG: Hpt domain-containing protein [Nevskiaceae bacterium]
MGHNLRGSAGAYGLPPLTEIGGRIEDAALKQDLAALAPAIAEMRRFLQAVKVPP